MIFRLSFISWLMFVLGAPTLPAQSNIPTYLDVTDSLLLTHSYQGPAPAQVPCPEVCCDGSCGGAVPFLGPRVEEMSSWLVGGGRCGG